MGVVPGAGGEMGQNRADILTVAPFQGCRMFRAPLHSKMQDLQWIVRLSAAQNTSSCSCLAVLCSHACSPADECAVCFTLCSTVASPRVAGHIRGGVCVRTDHLWVLIIPSATLLLFVEPRSTGYTLTLQVTDKWRGGGQGWAITMNFRVTALEIR